MKPIFISNENREALQAAINTIEGRAQMRCVSAEKIIELAQQGEDDCAKRFFLPKHKRAGTTLEYAPAGPSAASYTYSAARTFVVLERKSRGWYLVSVERKTCWPQNNRVFTYALKETQAAKAVAGFQSQFRVCSELRHSTHTLQQ